MKKIFVMLMVATLCLVAMTGCGKSDEEKARDEIAQHMKEEAAADGVDLEKMIGQEIADYEAKSAANQAAKDERAANKEALAEKYYSALDELRAKYEASTEPSEIKNTAQQYNALYSSMAKEAAEFNYDGYALPSDGGFTPIKKSMYQARMAYFSTAQNVATADTQMWLYYTSVYDVSDAGLDTSDPENYNSVMCLVNEIPDGWGSAYKDLTVVKNGTEVMRVDFAELGLQYLPFEFCAVNGQYIVLTGSGNGDYFYYVFDYSGSSLEYITDETMIEKCRNMVDSYAKDWSSPDAEGLNYLISKM